MKTLQEVHDMLVLTGYKEESKTVFHAMSIIDRFKPIIFGMEKIAEIVEETNSELEQFK